MLGYIDNDTKYTLSFVAWDYLVRGRVYYMEELIVPVVNVKTRRNYLQKEIEMFDSLNLQL